jgi:D-alanine transaminase
MSRIAYVAGQYLPHSQASVHIEDRGYQFADGVYEVVAVSGGRRIDDDRHFERLERSLGALNIPMPMSRRALAVVMDQVLRLNRVRDGIIYLQVTRGQAPRRDHAWSGPSNPVLTVTARRQSPPDEALARRGVAVITLKDQRWKRNDIKSVNLLANIMGKYKARAEGAYEAWLIDDNDLITEGTSTTAWIVSAEGQLVTRPLDEAILGGVTRAALIEIARQAGMEVEERPFSRTEALAAREAFLTSTSAYVLAIVSIDGQKIGDGRPGPVTMDLLDRYRRHVSGNNFS